MLAQRTGEESQRRVPHEGKARTSVVSFLFVDGHQEVARLFPDHTQKLMHRKGVTVGPVASNRDVEDGKALVAQLLLEQAVYLDAPQAKWGWTSLLLATRGGNLDVVIVV